MKRNKQTDIQENKRGKKPKKKRKVLKRILLILLLIIILVAGYVTYRTIRNGGGIQGFLATMVGHNENTLKDLDPVKVLLLGESEGLTDTILVASYNPKEQTASLLSIPRDTFVGKSIKSAKASDKINSLYNLNNKNPEKTLQAVNKLTGLEIEYYVVIDTEALIELVNTIGGVEFDVPIDMNYDDTSQKLRIHLKKGVQLLNGEQAEGLVRFRHNNNGTTYPSSYGEEDIGRMRTQREFITAVMQQTLKPSNILKIGNFLDIAHKNVKTNFPLSVAKDYIPYIVNFSTENLQTDTLPGESKLTNGVWIYVHDGTKTKTIVEQLFLSTNNTTQEDSNTSEAQNTSSDITTNKDTSSIRIELLNGSGTSSNLSKLTTKLKNAGYNVVKTGNATQTAKTSIINRTYNGESVYNVLKEAVGIGSVVSGEDNSNVDFTIIIGKDY